MQIFLKFMGWFILYSLLYFLVLDIAGHPPGMKGAPRFIRTLNFYLLPLITLPLWWFSWCWFESLFGPRMPVSTPAGTVYRFALRNPALMYYLMLLKPFLLVMGANGIITLDQHGGGWKIFYIINCIVLYIYALPFFIIKFIKLKKALQAAVTVDDTGISLSVKGKQLAGIAFADAQSVMVESEPLGLCVSGPGGSVCLGSRKSRISGFYIPGLEQIVEIVRAKAGRVEQVSGLKGSLKGRGIKPLL